MATRHTKPIDADVLDVLKRSTITPNSLTLPGQLERKLYDRTAKVIAAAISRAIHANSAAEGSKGSSGSAAGRTR